MKKKLRETAAAGATGAGSIAVRTDNSRLGGMQTRMSLKDFMVDFYGRLNNRNKFHQVKLESISNYENLTESTKYPFQLNTTLSKMSAAEIDGSYEKKDTVSFGVEDDNGNIMVVTVPLTQAESFERRVAQTLADVLEFKKTGRGEDKNLAELLYELKDEFTIVDAQFPTIPKDAIYNADEISTLPESDEDMGMEGDDEEGFEDDEEGLDDLEGEEGLEGEEDELEDLGDEEVGDEFDEETDKESLLKSVLAMINTQNEKEIAQANAEAEKAKARQAEMAMKSAQGALENEEEMIAAEAEMEAEKDREKEAKKMAELAKYKYKQQKGLGEGFSPFFRDVLLEFDPNDTPQTLRRQMTTVRQKWQPDPGDSDETRRYKQNQLQLAMRKLRIELQAAREREEYEKSQEDQEQQQRQQQQQQQQQPDQEQGL